MKRDGATISLWQSNTEEYEAIPREFSQTLFDVLIIGGGITGITTALELQKAGKKCILAEAATIGFGTTGGTTAHLNSFFDTPYHTMEKNFGSDNAHLVAAGAQEALSLIKNNISDYNIACEFEERSAYIFTVKEEQNKELEDLVDGAKKMGLPVDFTNTTPLPIPYLKIACIEKQYQFHPLDYIFRLAKIFEDTGGVILQHCRITKIEEKEVLEATTTKGNIKAGHVVYATHIPPGVNLLHFRCAPYRSYAMAVKLRSDYPMALAYDMNDPYHYYRTQKIGDDLYLIAGGEDHKTGHEENTDKCFRNLEAYIRTFFDIEEIAYKWSSQYYEPVDGLPYIGHLPGNPNNVFVATGFGGNGMIYGTLSGIILSDMLVKGGSKYQKLFDPNRIKPIAGFNNFVKEAADVVSKLIGGKFSAEKIEGLNELAAGEAKVVKYEGNIIALYKDEAHNIHAVNSACTHIKCTVTWNAAEKSWDCPCHGSRFDADGVMLNAPARKDLEKIDMANPE